MTFRDERHPSKLTLAPIGVLAFAALAACGSTASPGPDPSEGGTGAAAGAAAQVTGGTNSGGSPSSGGASPAQGGAAVTSGGASDGGTAGAFGAGAGGTSGSAGVSGAAGASAGGANAGAGGIGGGSAGASGAAGSPTSGGFNPCPAKGSPCTIMPLGDSITYGYGSTNPDDGSKNGGGYRVELLRAAVAAGVSITFVGSQMSGPAKVDGLTFPRNNEGYSGYTIDQVSAKVDAAMSSYKPNIVLMMVGTNDMHGSVDLTNAPTRLGKIIDRVVADAPNALLVVAAPIPANGAQDGLTKTFDAAVPGVVQTRASAGKHVLYVDMYTPMAPWGSARFNDSEHPNDAGYKIMAQTWYPKISALLR